MTRQVIKRGILQSLDTTTYTASVMILEATNDVITGIPFANQATASVAAGVYCAVLFFDEGNPTDAVVLCTYPRT